MAVAASLDPVNELEPDSLRSSLRLHRLEPTLGWGGVPRGTWPGLRRLPRSTRPGSDSPWRRYLTHGERPARRVSRTIGGGPATRAPAAALATWSRARSAWSALQARPRPRDGSEGRGSRRSRLR